MPPLPNPDPIEFRDIKPYKPEPVVVLPTNVLDTENQSYTMEEFYKYWKENEETVEESLKQEFLVSLSNF